MACWANRHTWSWGATTTADPVPLALRCDCGAISRNDEVAHLRVALEFYASPGNWSEGFWTTQSNATRDRGSRARAALGREGEG